MNSLNRQKRMDKICIFGGSFDPLHLGHLAMAETAHREFGFPKITLMPNNATYYKQRKTEDTSSHRLAMVRLCSEHYSYLTFSDMEIRRGGTTLTIDTVEALKREDPEREVYFLLGGDSLAWLDKWVRADELLALTHFIAAVRGDVGKTEAKALIQKYKEAYPGSDIQLLSLPEIRISSTAVRERIAGGKDFRELVPPCVADYIEEHGLYGWKRPETL